MAAALSAAGWPATSDRALDVCNVFKAQNAISYNENSTSGSLLWIALHRKPRFIRPSARIAFEGV